IVRFVARGGMGEVYEAEDVELRGRIALKTIHPAAVAEGGAVERFKREIQLARRVTHPNVCRIFDVGYHGAAPGAPPHVFLTMELLEGETLAARLRRVGRLTPAAALPIARQLAEALQAAHEVGIVHRDFKTENVFLVPGASGERAVVTDFGIARAAPDERYAATLTADGSAIGTPAYMAPEQIEGRGVSAATDQYAFGIVLFEMVTGELPFRGDSPLATAARRLTEPPPSPRDFAPELDATWEAAILRCLERRPEDRFRDVRAAVRALEGEAAAPPASRELPVAVAAQAAALPAPLPAPQSLAPSPRGVRSAAEQRKRWLAATLVATLAVASGWAWLRVREIRDRLAADAPSVSRRAVAVLEPRNLAGRADAAWLGTALAEMLASEIAQGQGLRVVPGESVARAVAELGLAGSDRLDAAGRARLRRRLGADLLVVGAYTALPAQGGVRVDLRLEDARSDEALATLRESGREEELFALVGRVGGALRAALGAAADAAGARAALPTSPEAARLYAEGLEALRAFDLRRGRELLERAVAAAPDNALARSALAAAWGSLGYRARAEQEGRRAVELASGLAVEERLVVEARYFEAAHDWPQAAETWQRLWTAYPDMLPYGLRLAGSRLEAGDPTRALATALALRNLPAPDGQDPRIDLLEAGAAGALGDFQRQADAAARAAERADSEGAALLAAEARLARGSALRQLGRLAEASSAIERARQAFDEHANRAGVFAADSALGGVLLDQGQPDAARTAFLRSHALAQELGDRGAEATALNNLAVLARHRGENEPARASYEQVLAIFEETGNRAGAAFAANNLAVCLTELGELAEAERRVATALASWRESGDRVQLAAALGTHGGVARRKGDLPAAEAAWREALALRRETGQRPGEAVALNGLAQVQLERGALLDAATSFAAAAALARELGAKSVLAAALAGTSEVQAAGDERGAALAAASEALGLRRELGDRVGVARVRLAIAELDLAGDRRAVVAVAKELVDAPDGSLPPDVEAGARLLLARAAAADGDGRTAREALAAGDLVGRLSAAQRLRWRVAEAEAARASGRAAEGRETARLARDEAARLGLLGVELEAELAHAELAGLATGDVVLRARAAGFEALARRAEGRGR
ncbi:MAG: serine/threonine-protein kinase, partial [Thermoanaerobaculia bacterium]|nr:serine/threonine-protein kinase [Thermoanaerobaculia bacterium]